MYKDYDSDPFGDERVPADPAAMATSPFAGAMTTLGRGLGRWWRHFQVAQTASALSRLDARTLADIGLDRGDLHAAAARIVDAARAAGAAQAAEGRRPPPTRWVTVMAPTAPGTPANDAGAARGRTAA